MPAVRRSHVVHFRAHATLLDSIDRASALAGMPRSEWLRQLAGGAAAQQLAQAEQEAARRDVAEADPFEGAAHSVNPFLVDEGR